MVLAQIILQCPFTYVGNIFYEGGMNFVNDIGCCWLQTIETLSPSLIPKVGGIIVWDQQCLVQTCYHKLCHNLVLYEPLFLHSCLVHIVPCHNYSKPPHQPINTMHLETFWLSSFHRPMVKFYVGLGILIQM